MIKSILNRICPKTEWGDSIPRGFSRGNKTRFGLYPAIRLSMPIWVAHRRGYRPWSDDYAVGWWEGKILIQLINQRHGIVLAVDWGWNPISVIREKTHASC